MDVNNKRKSHGSPPTDSLGHTRPRRTSPEQSVTLQHHRHARQAAERSRIAKPGAPDVTLSRRNSSGDSHATARSNPKTWFDQSNRNDKTTFDDSMDVDPPFYQKETESSNGEPPPYPFGAGPQVPFLRPGATQSSSADDYRSVIDDLTIENKRLKEELKRYKQFGPDMMRKEKLFEIKVHGLPKRKKRELEATLRDFAASLGGSSESPPQHNNKKHGRRGLMDHIEQSNSKHASSSSSRSRPVDSAYASMSTGPSSNAHTNAHNSTHVVGRPSVGIRTRTSTEQKVEDYLRETPGGLFPRHVVMTDKDKKKTVVRRLEQLFTGKIGRKALSQLQPSPAGDLKSASDPALPTLPMAPPPNAEAVREARIQPNDPSGRKPRSRDNVSMSNSNGDQTDSGGHQVEGGDGSTVAVPSENLEYIRHLGLVQPGFTVPERSHESVSPDADGWVYLNLLCNLAQLHIFNVTPNFIRAAVTEKSTKFQLSPDGRKIRWRGGTDGTRFSSDSGGDNSQRSGSGEDTDGSDASGRRKRARTQQGSATWGSNQSGLHTGSSDSFHYKPLFIRHSSSIETSLEGTGSLASDPLLDGSNMGNSKWDYSGSGSSQRKKRRVDGAIVYYSGAPFCIDLSGDPGDVSPSGYRASAGQQQQSEESEETDSPPRLAGHRTLSGSSLPIRPLSEAKAVVSDTSDSESDSDQPPDALDDETSTLNGEEVEFPWCDDPQEFDLRPNDSTLEACGLGGVLPEDHFVIVVATKRPMVCKSMGAPTLPPRSKPKGSLKSILNQQRLARTASPNRGPTVVGSGQAIEIEEMDMKIWRLRPMPLPPAAMFFDPFSSDTDSECSEEETDDEDDIVLQHHMDSAPSLSQRANPHLSSSSGEDEESVEEVRQNVAKLVSREDSSDVVRLHPLTIPSAGTRKLLHEGSSVATAGGAESGYSSSMEDDAR